MSWDLKVNRVVFVKHFAWYLSIVKINGEPVAFWSHHNRQGLKDKEAEIAFEKEHYKEVIHLTKQHLQNRN